MKYDPIMCMNVPDSVKTKDAVSCKAIDKALRFVDKLKVEVCDFGDQNKIVNWCVIDISSGRILKEHCKNEKEAILWAKKQGYEV